MEDCEYVLRFGDVCAVADDDWMEVAKKAVSLAEGEAK